MADNSSSAEPQVEGGSDAELETERQSGRDGQDVAASSSEAKGETKETLLEAVLRAVDEPGEGEGSTAAPPAGDNAQSEQGEDKDGKEPDLNQDPSQEELAGYKDLTRRRIEKLISERNSYRSEADVTRTLREFLVANDIAREDFQLTLDLAAAMRRGDFRGFLEGISPYVNLATQALGITLPTDLDQAVKAGRMTFDVAAHVSRERYARALAEQQATRASQISTQVSQAQQQAHLSQSIEQTVNTWEAGVRRSDPDYARKEATVRNLLWSVVQERGAPQSPEQAVEIAKEAYKRANDTIRQFAPPPRPTRQVPNSSTHRAASGARSEPKSLMEAAMLGLERARQRAS